ncbi:MAG: FAD-dependent oxidoreductase [Hyphomonadaceae bacterium]|nr:FAD-dependent oxidoreductase [Hyphomonadaceae bacterium]
MLASLSAAALSACASAVAPSRPSFQGPAALPPILVRADRITRITVCTRPFRPAGPRLDVETVGAKRVVHNYGHGGAGWSLSWGSAEIAARRALEGGAKEVAVIGCGAIGLTTAITLQRAGAKVRIYAKERTPQSRSFRATGLWSPDSRIADADRMGGDFPARWEAMTRASWAAHQTYLGMPGAPVSFTERYLLRDAAAPDASADRAGHRPDPAHIRFASFADRIRDINPRLRDLDPAEHPFPVPRVRAGANMMFNVGELSHRLTEDFLREGGTIAPMEFHTPADLAALPETAIVNCTGYGARTLWKDDALTPVRGQIAWLVPQPEANYAFVYRGVSVLARPDGVVVQQVGANDMHGVGDADETPDRAEAEAALNIVAPLFAAAA